ncbi:hypothetical protein V3N99_13245 [Dermatophilaceae bacterium Soc4.6]
MSPVPGDDSDRDSRRRARQVARDLHPDRGGDPDAYVAAMQLLAHPGDAPTPVTPVQVRQRRWRQLPNRARRRMRAWRRDRRRRSGSGWTQL